MNRKTLILFLIALFFSVQSAYSKMYECTTFVNGQKRVITKSFNSLIPTRSDYSEMTKAIKRGDCKELIVKKYFLEGISCNIHFYKFNYKIAGMSCYGNKQSAVAKLKEIARKEYGYLGR